MIAAFPLRFLDTLLIDVSGQALETEPGIPPGPLNSRHALKLRQGNVPVPIAHSLSGAASTVAALLMTHLFHSTKAVLHPGLDTSTTGQNTTLKTETSDWNLGHFSQNGSDTESFQQHNSL